MMKEGCLSFPDIYIMLKRPKVVVMDYQTVEGEQRSIKLEGLGARCVQHEIDHLNGVIFLQRASQLKIERALKARPKERAKRLEYEQRRAIAEALRTQNAEKSADSERVQADNTLSQNAS